MISFKIKYDESVKIANKKISKGGGVISEDMLRFVIFFWLMKQMGILFQFSVWISMKLIFKILIWTVQIKRFEAQVLD